MSNQISSPSSTLYKWSGRFAAYAKIALWIASAIIALTLLWPCVTALDNWYYVKFLQILSTVLYQVFTIASAVCNFKARKIKINDLVDNSFGTSHSDKHSEGYFDNEDANNEVAKYYLNTAESCFFSMKEMEHMRASVYSKGAILVLMLVLALILRNTDIILSIFQITILFTIIISTVKFVVVINELQRLFCRIETSLKHKSTKLVLLADAINYSLEYETIMAWYSSILPNIIYQKYNESLTAEWNQKKTKYKL